MIEFVVQRNLGGCNDFRSRLTFVLLHTYSVPRVLVMFSVTVFHPAGVRGITIPNKFRFY